MKRFSLFLMIVLLVSAIFISCSAEPAADATSVVEVAISLPKALNVDSEADPDQALPQVNSLYWFYTAVKADNGFKTGATGSTLTAIRTDGSNHTITTGLPAVIGYTGDTFSVEDQVYPVGQAFSTGIWRFSFYGYKQINPDGTPNGNPVYQYVCSDTQAPNVTVNYTEADNMIGGNANITLEIVTDTRVSGKVIIESIDVEFGNAIDSSDYTLTVTASGISNPIATSVVNGSDASNGTITFFSQAYEINVSNTAESNVIAPRFYTLSFAVTKAGDSSNTYASGEISIHARLGYNVTIDGFLNSLESVAYVQINNNTNITQAQNENVFTISSEDELRAFASYVNQGNSCAGMTIKLDAVNIDISGESWTPIGNSYRGQEGGAYFAGTFDGQGNTISGLTLAADADVAKDSNGEYVFGLFGVVKNATIKDLNMTNVQIDKVETEGYYGENVAAVVGYSEGKLTLENITVGADSEDDNSYINGAHVAGVISRAYGKSTGIEIKISNCTNYADITASNNIDGKAKAAGIAAYVSGQGADVTIEGCKNFGAISSTDTNNAIAAGIVVHGFNNSYIDDYTVNSNINEGAITLSGGSPLYAKISAECYQDPVENVDSISATDNSSTGTVTVNNTVVTNNTPLVRDRQGGTEVNVNN